MSICMVVQFEEDLFLLCSGAKYGFHSEAAEMETTGIYLPENTLKCTIILE